MFQQTKPAAVRRRARNADHPSTADRSRQHRAGAPEASTTTLDTGNFVHLGIIAAAVVTNLQSKAARSA
jgi:hypothetical protein